ncbi:MAG: hypothetical protein CME64_15780 [Halobacteriovoraceae bacterium]|nr:hypothetical protein [Halobacteriovoraceae bacterium]|tara:strand:- start:4643 stop:5440 length:798 start_codon:yes stop_codon:yes gene_type:complete
MKLNFLLIILALSTSALAQFNQAFDMEDDLEIGGDIFSDFNEDLEAAQVEEDERFYRYSRFVSFNLGVGMTTFSGNRGLAYEDNHPSFGLSLMYFLDFQNVFTMGIEYSEHTMFIDTFVNAHRTQILGAVETSMLRPFFGFRYYIDTSDLGTAITYSNPYLTGRLEYWYQTNKFIERKNISDQSDGGIGVAFGAGLEFPIEIKKRYFNVEILYHRVNFFDKHTMDYRQIPADDPDHDFAARPSEYGYEDLTGNSLSVFFNYVLSW